MASPIADHQLPQTVPWHLAIKILQYPFSPEDRNTVWEQAHECIKRYNGQGSASHAVLEGWPDEEKRQFITWRTTILATAQKRSWKQRLQLPAMTRQEYIQKLTAVTLDNDSSLKQFTIQTGIRDYPEPLFLGCEAGNQYRFLPQLVPHLDAQNPWSRNCAVMSWLEEILSSSGVTLSCRFVLPLGMLGVIPAGSTNAQFANITPFRVCLNVVDRSIWLIMTSTVKDSLGSPIQIPSGFDTWSFLHLNANGRNSWDSVKLMSWIEFSSFDQNYHARRQFLTSESLSTAKLTRHNIYMPSVIDVKEAVNGR